MCKKNNLLYLKNPELFKQIHPDKNEGVDFNKLTCGIKRKIIWIYQKGHNYDSTISHRIEGNNCPYCSGQRVCMDNCLATLKPHLAKDWHPTKNENLTPFNVTCFKNKKVWWICEKNHEYESNICNRSKGDGCPYCSGQKVCIDNCFSTLNPELSKEWHITKNDDLTPFDVTPNSHKKVWWTCEKNHEYFTAISSRGRGDNCPYCSNHKVCIDNCLSTLNPELSKEWHPTKNKNLTQFNVTPNSHKKAWWICENNHEYESIISNRNNGRGCSICNDSKGENEIKKILKKHNISFERQKTFKDCKNINCLPFDFYLQEHNLCIEYDGIQHFKIIEFFGGLKSLELTQKKDKIRTDYCIGLNERPNLLRIKYDENIEEKLNEFLKIQKIL